MPRADPDLSFLRFRSSRDAKVAERWRVRRGYPGIPLSHEGQCPGAPGELVLGVRDRILHTKQTSLKVIDVTKHRTARTRTALQVDLHGG